MSDNTPDEPTQAAPVEPPAAPAGYEAAPPPAYDPVASAQAAYQPMPLQVTDTQSRNWMGVVALITGIIGISIAAIVFGILGLNAVKNGKATNKGSNIAGIVLGAVWIVISIVASIVFFAWVADKVEDATPTMANAEVGDCYLSTPANIDSVDGDGIVFGSCEMNNAEVFYVGTYDGTARPTGDSSMEDLAEVCVTEAALSHLDRDLVATYRLELFAPNAGSWDTNPHTVVCAVANDSGPVDPGAVSE